MTEQSTQRLRAGDIARIRVNPTDCVSVLDLLDKVGIDYRSMSFAQCVSLALSSLLETARIHKNIPTPTGFDYLSRMAPFHQGHTSHRRKLQITQAIGTIGSEFHAPALPVEDSLSPSQILHSTPPATDEVSPEQRRQRRRLAELNQKLELSQTPGSGIVWMGEDQNEFDELVKAVYG